MLKMNGYGRKGGMKARKRESGRRGKPKEDKEEHRTHNGSWWKLDDCAKLWIGRYGLTFRSFSTSLREELPLLRFHHQTLYHDKLHVADTRWIQHLFVPKDALGFSMRNLRNQFVVALVFFKWSVLRVKNLRGSPPSVHLRSRAESCTHSTSRNGFSINCRTR